MAVRRLMCVALATTLLYSLTVSRSTAATSPKISSSAPCGQVRMTTYTHVVWILLENQGYSVVGSPSAPYFNELANHCALATNDFAVSHPSLPNYIALTSGSTQGIADDGEPSTHPLAVPSIFSQLGTNWRGLIESMPGRCDRVTSGVYAARHNPAVYYTNIAPACQRNDVPLATPLKLSAKFTMIVPNVCNDMHSCPVATGDAWLKRFVPLIVQSPQYQSRSLVLFITFDENDLDASNQIPTLVIAPSTPSGLRVGAKFTHYSLLRTTETLLHLAPLAGAKTAPSMVGPFHL
jgi:phosphatidylinositol-3-phosphatase